MLTRNHRSITSSKNKFVQLALEKTLQLAWETLSAQPLVAALASGADITIVGDNDFYSQRAQVNKSHNCRMNVS